MNIPEADRRRASVERTGTLLSIPVTSQTDIGPLQGDQERGGHSMQGNAWHLVYGGRNGERSQTVRVVSETFTASQRPGSDLRHTG